MNIITVISEKTPHLLDGFIKGLKDYGGGASGDTLTVICSKYEQPFNVAAKERLDKHFDEVNMFERSLVPLEGDPIKHSEMVTCQNWRFAGLQGVGLYIPLGYAPSEKGWLKTVKNEYSLGGKSWMGSGPVECVEPLRYELIGPVVLNVHDIHVVPPLQIYSPRARMFKRATHYVNRSLHLVELPFEKVPNKALESLSQPPKKGFDVNAPFKAGSLPVGPSYPFGEPKGGDVKEDEKPVEEVAPPAAKKATKKTAKTAKKKTARKGKKATKPISADILQAATQSK